MTFNVHHHDPDETHVIPKVTAPRPIQTPSPRKSSDKVGLIMLGMICGSAILIALICSIGAVRVFG
jgi:hypothetical protein